MIDSILSGLGQFNMTPQDTRQFEGKTIPVLGLV